MPFPLLIPAFLGLCKVCAIVGGAVYCTHKVAKAYQKGQKTKQKKIDAKSQADMAKINAANESKQKLQTEEADWKKKHDDLEKRMNQRDKEIEEASRKAKDQTLPEEEEKWRVKLAALTSSQDEDRREKNKILDKLKSITEQIKKQDSIISSTGSTSYDDKHWIMNLFTLENALILGGCYLLYKLTKDDK